MCINLGLHIDFFGCFWWWPTERLHQGARLTCRAVHFEELFLSVCGTDADVPTYISLWRSPLRPKCWHWQSSRVVVQSCSQFLMDSLYWAAVTEALHTFALKAQSNSLFFWAAMTLKQCCCGSKWCGSVVSSTKIKFCIVLYRHNSSVQHCMRLH